MLEESAAQLAALRQRAEYLLDQLSVGSEAAPNREKANMDSEDQSPASGDNSSAEPERLPNSSLEPKGMPPFAPPQDKAALPRAFSQSTEESQQSVQQPDPPPAPPTASYQDGQHTPDSSYHADNSSQPEQAVDPPAEASLSSDQPDFEPLTPNEIQPVDYPIQNYPAQQKSLLDSPITIAPPTMWRVEETWPGGSPTDAQLIEEEIISLYEAIDRVRETRRENTGHALSLLREAREIISAEPQRLARAHYNIEQAKQIIDRARFSRSRSRGIAARTFGLLILWLGALGGLAAALYLYPRTVNETIAIVASSTGWNTTHYYSILWAVATGGIGGCLGTISFLVERMRVHEEFDRQYILRSTIQPLMGVVLGLITYGLLASLVNGLGAPITAHPVTSYLPAALALPIGIWQVYVYAVIFRITRLLTFQRRRRW